MLPYPSSLTPDSYGPLTSTPVPGQHYLSGNPGPRLDRRVLRIPGEVTKLRQEHVPFPLQGPTSLLEAPGRHGLYRSVLHSPSQNQGPVKGRKPDLLVQSQSMHLHIYLPSLLVYFTHFKIANTVYAHEKILNSTKDYTRERTSPPTSGSSPSPETSLLTVPCVQSSKISLCS